MRSARIGAELGGGHSAPLLAREEGGAKDAA
jgi:hypothetical protein